MVYNIIKLNSLVIIYVYMYIFFKRTFLGIAGRYLRKVSEIIPFHFQIEHLAFSSSCIFNQKLVQQCLETKGMALEYNDTFHLSFRCIIKSIILVWTKNRYGNLQHLLALRYRWTAAQFQSPPGTHVPSAASSHCPQFSARCWR